MTNLTTHSDTVKKAGIKVFTSTNEIGCNASDVLRATFSKNGYDTKNPAYIFCENEIDYDDNCAFAGMENALRLPHISVEQQGRTIKATLFGDQSCLITWQDTASGKIYMVPWIFRLRKSFLVPGHGLTHIDFAGAFPIIPYHRKPTKNDMRTSMRASLLEETRHDREPKSVKTLRIDILTILHAEMTALVDAFCSAPPLARTHEDIAKTQTGELAFPYFADWIPRPSSRMGTLLKDLLTYFLVRHPKFKSITIYSRKVEMDGTQGIMHVSINPPNDASMAISIALEQMLDAPNPYLDLTQILGRRFKSTTILGTTHISQLEQPSAHQRIEVMNKLGPYLLARSDTDPACKIPT